MKIILPMYFVRKKYSYYIAIFVNTGFNIVFWELSMCKLATHSQTKESQKDFVSSL